MVDAKLPGLPIGAPAKPAPARTEPQEEKIVTPKVEGFMLPGTRVKDVSGIIGSLSALSFLQIAQEGDSVALLNVESRDIRRSPYLFSTIYLRPDEIEIIYTLIPGMSPRKRRIDVWRHLLNILTLVADAYHLDEKHFYQALQSSLSGIVEFASSEYKDVFAKYDSCLYDLAESKKAVERLEATNTRLGRELIEAKSRGDELTLRVRQLEGYSDEALMGKIQDWLDVHRNEINISDFAKQYSLVESRVEDMLNKMVMQGYLELRG